MVRAIEAIILLEESINNVIMHHITRLNDEEALETITNYRLGIQMLEDEGLYDLAKNYRQQWEEETQRYKKTRKR